MKKSGFALAVFCVAASLAGYATAGLSAAEQLSLLTTSARTAQQRCHEFMHEDADEFVSCIDAIERAVDRRTAWSEVRRLGIVYFAWVAAHNSARVALPGAEAAVTRYFDRMRRLQRQTGIDDRLLCRSVPGDCPARLALIERAGVKVYSGTVKK